MQELSSTVGPLPLQCVTLQGPQQSPRLNTSIAARGVELSAPAAATPAFAAVAHTRNSRSVSAVAPPLPILPRQTSSSSASASPPISRKVSLATTLNLPGPRTQFRIGPDARGKWSVQEEEEHSATPEAKRSPRNRLESAGTVSGGEPAADNKCETGAQMNGGPPPAFSPTSLPSRKSSANNLKLVARELQVAVERLSEEPKLPTAVVNSRREADREADSVLSIRHKRRHFYCALLYLLATVLVLPTEIAAFVIETGLYMFGMGFVCTFFWLLAGLLSLRVAGVCAALWRRQIRALIVALAAIVFIAGLVAGFLAVLGVLGITCEANSSTRISLCGAGLSSTTDSTVASSFNDTGNTNATGTSTAGTTAAPPVSAVILIDLVKLLLGVVVGVVAVVQSCYLWFSIFRWLRLCPKQNFGPSVELANAPVAAAPPPQQCMYSPPQSAPNRTAMVFSTTQSGIESLPAAQHIS